MLPMSIAGVLIQLVRLGEACRQLCHGADQRGFASSLAGSLRLTNRQQCKRVDW